MTRPEDAPESFIPGPSQDHIVVEGIRSVEDEIAKLLGTDQATRADLAVSLTHLREAQTQLLMNQATLEQSVRQRTAELLASRDQLQTVNDRLRIEVDGHKQTDDARRSSEHNLRLIVESAPISMAVVGMDGTIEYINRKAIETFGYRPGDIPNMDRWWVQAYPDPEYRAESIKRWMGYVASACAEGREIQRDNYRITCKDGAVKTIAIFGVPVAGKVFVMFDDITIQAFKDELLRRSHAELERGVRERTAELAERNRLLQAEIVERRQIEDQLVQANLELARTTSQLRKLGAKLARVEEQERKRMAYILHDQLQQALVAARFNLSALKQQPDAAVQEIVCAARTAVDEALRESKSLVLELSPPILREGGIAHAMKWLRLRMHEKHGLTVLVDVDGRAGMLEEDLRLAIFHAVRELLLNVVKHARVSSASVAIAMQPDARISIAVSDKGCGFDPTAADRRDDTDLGFGLLAIRERFDALGGHMTVESRPGHGCRVTLIAPIAPAPVASEESSGKKGPQARAGTAGTEDLQPVASPKKRIRVLLADDHTMLRQGLMQLLARDPGIEVVGEAPDGEVAVEQARALRPDVVLMDIGMPRMGGIEATQAIHAEFPKMIIIGLSMHAESDRGNEIRKAGASAYVSKSEASEVLVATIHTCCGR